MMKQLLPVCLLALVLLTACSKYSRIPASQFGGLNEKPKHGYRVTTTRGDVIRAKSIVVQDTTMTITAVTEEDTSEMRLPAVLGLSEIGEIEEIGVNYSPLVPVVIIAVIVTVIVRNLALAPQ